MYRPYGMDDAAVLLAQTRESLVDPEVDYGNDSEDDMEIISKKWQLNGAKNYRTMN